MAHNMNKYKYKDRELDQAIIQLVIKLVIIKKPFLNRYLCVVFIEFIDSFTKFQYIFLPKPNNTLRSCQMTKIQSNSSQQLDF